MKTSLEQRLIHQPDALNHIMFGLDDGSIKQRPDTDKWSIFENLAHLGRYHEVFKERIQRILHEDHPHFPRYSADKDPGFAAWCKYDPQLLLKRFTETRKELNEFLFSLSDEQLKRSGHHPVWGLMSINGWTEFFLLHEAHHFFTILKLAPQTVSTD